MPIYEYVCQACDRKTEVIQNFGEKRLRICPRCGGKLKKAFSAPAIHFKGSGFYLTDYGRGKTGPTTEGKADSAPKESKSAESKPSEAKELKDSKEPKKEKTDSKTESKKESKKKED